MANTRDFDSGDCCLRNGKSETLHIQFGDDSYYLQVLYYSNIAKLGIWLSKIPRTVLLAVRDYIFRTHTEVSRIVYRQSYVPLGLSEKTNHFRIVLPDSAEEIMTRMKKHERQNLKNRLRKLEDTGAIFYDYKADRNNPEAIEAINKFFEMKNASHGTVYNFSSEELIQVYQLSDVYVIRLDNKIVAVRLASEQCAIAGGQNITYDRYYDKLCLGVCLQYYVLKELIRKGKKELFLGWSRYLGQQVYKQHFNSIEESTYRGIIYRNFGEYIAAYLHENLVRKPISIFKTFLKAILPPKVVSIIRRIKNGR